MRRRDLFLGMMLTAPAADSQDIRASEWDASFREFLKQMNRFIETLNDGMFDRKQWLRCKAAWKRLEEFK